jgi:hypothetical protein
MKKVKWKMDWSKFKNGKLKMKKFQWKMEIGTYIKSEE